MHDSRPLLYRLSNVSVAGCSPFPVLEIGENTVALTALRPTADALGLALSGTTCMALLLADWPINGPALEQLAQHITRHGWLGPSLSDTNAVMHAPVMPRQVFCTIGNYRSQLTEAFIDKARAENAEAPLTVLTADVNQLIEQRLQGQPYICSKLPSTLIGPYDDFQMPEHSNMVDWEVELGVVIAKQAHNVAAEDAMTYVAGFTVVNDITLRDQVFRAEPSGFGTDWLQSKDAHGCLPTGPYFIPAACITNPLALNLTLKLNGETMQAGSTADMIFPIAEQIAYLSTRVRLLPGDLICTGSPAGFGAHHGRFIRAGDTLVASIEGFGSQRINCVQSPKTNHRNLQ